MIAPKFKIIAWLFSYLALGVLGSVIGMNAIIPGPTSYNALMDNEGERIAIEHNLAPKDGFLILLSKKTEQVSEEYFDKAQKVLIDLLKSKTLKEEGGSLFGMIQSSEDTFSIDKTKFISADQKTRLIIASGKLPVYESPKEFLEVPDILKSWNLSFPEFEFGYLSNSTGEEEVFRLVQRDLDQSLIYTTPLTILILVWAFRSFLAALIPIGIAGVSLVGSLGVSAMLSQFVDGISVTAAQLIVLLVLAIGVDYSLFFLTRAREERSAGYSVVDAILRTRKSTGVAIIWSGIIVAVSLFGLLLIQDTVLNSMAMVAIIAVFMTLFSCVLVLPNVLQIFSSCLEVKQNEKKASVTFTEKLINLSLVWPKAIVFILILLLTYLSYFGFQLNLGNTMLPSVLPKSLHGMATYQLLEEKFPALAGGDASVILQGDNLEELDESGEIEEVFQKLNAFGLRGPFKIDKTLDSKLARYKFLLNGLGDDAESQVLVRRLRDEILPGFFKPLGVESYFSGVVEHSVSEADKYKSKMPLLFSAVLGLSFLFLLIAFRSIVIPIKAILLNLLSTTASFGILVLVFQYWVTGPFYIGVIESFVPPLLFTILFGLSMDYHVFMISRISEEFHKSLDTREAVKLGINRTSKTITSAALIMISVFFVAATLELPVMRQLGIGLGVAVLIDATLVRAMLLPASMVLLGKWNWYLPRFLKSLPEIKVG